MAIIGAFTQRGETLIGAIQTLTLDVELEIRRADKPSENAPDFRIYARGTAKGPSGSDTEVGAAWKRTSQQDREYLSVKLDDPALPAPLFASLVSSQGEDQFHLLWTRP